MKKVMLVGCGAYMDSGYGCAGEWRCLKAAALGEGNFDDPAQVISFVKCECVLGLIISLGSFCLRKQN